MSVRFWQSPKGNLVINLSYIVGIRRSVTDCRVVQVFTTCPDVTFLVDVGSEERSLLDALARAERQDGGAA